MAEVPNECFFIPVQCHCAECTKDGRVALWRVLVCICDHKGSVYECGCGSYEPNCFSTDPEPHMYHDVPYGRYDIPNDAIVLVFDETPHDNLVLEP